MSKSLVSPILVMGKFYVPPWIYGEVFALTCVRRENNSKSNAVGL